MKVTLRRTPLGATPGSANVKDYLVGAYMGYDIDLGPDFTVTSSNPDVATAFVEYDENGWSYLLVTAWSKTGTAKITITATDGSGKKATITVKVVN